MISGIWQDQDGEWWANVCSLQPKDEGEKIGIAVGDQYTRLASSDEVDIVNEAEAIRLKALGR